jgi:hypothetical protein
MARTKRTRKRRLPWLEQAVEDFIEAVYALRVKMEREREKQQKEAS